MQKIKVILEATGLNFFWAEKGYKDADGKEMTCCWEDVSYQVFINDKDMGTRHTNVDSRAYIRYEIDDLHHGVGQKMELKYPGYVEEELNCTTFGIPFRDMINCDEIRLGYCYDHEGDPDLYESDLDNLPLNEFGRKPCYVFGYIPDENLSKKGVEKCIDFMIKAHFSEVERECEISFEWQNDPSDEDLDKEWKNYLGELEHFAEMRAKGETFKIAYAVPFLIQMYGEEVIAPYIEKGLVSGEPMGEAMGNDVLLNFKDGHTEMLKNNDELEADHFGEPKYE